MSPKTKARHGSYPAQELRWVREILVRLTPDERTEYERRMREASGHHSTGKKYDILKAEVAEEVMQEFRRRGAAPPSSPDTSVWGHPGEQETTGQAGSPPRDPNT